MEIFFFSDSLQVAGATESRAFGDPTDRTTSFDVTRLCIPAGEDLDAVELTSGTWLPKDPTYPTDPTYSYTARLQADLNTCGATMTPPRSFTVAYDDTLGASPGGTDRKLTLATVSGNFALDLDHSDYVACTAAAFGFAPGNHASATSYIGPFAVKPVHPVWYSEVRHSRLFGTSSLVMFEYGGAVFINTLVVGSNARAEHFDGPKGGWAMQHDYCADGGVCEPLVWNNTFVLNAPLGSDGVTVSNSGAWSSTEPGFINNIVAFNHVSGVYADAIPTDHDLYASFHHNHVYGNPTCQYCLDDPLRETLYPGGPHYQEAPLFEDLTDDGDFFNDDLRLQGESPMINAGDPSLLDPDGSISDVGVYGGPEGSW